MFAKHLLLLTALLVVSGCTSSPTPTLSTPLISIPGTSEDQWLTYSNKELGISFQIPEEWPLPSLESDSSSVEKFDNSSLWRLSLGPLNDKGCEGQPCYDYFVDGYESSEAGRMLNELKNNDLVEIIRDTYINGYKTIAYKEGGICGSKTALIFGVKYTVKFTARCGDDNGKISDTFDFILSTFQFTNDKLSATF